MVELIYCMGCQMKVEPATSLEHIVFKGSRGERQAVRSTCSKGHKIVKIIKK